MHRLLLAVLRLTKNPVLFPLRAFAIGYIILVEIVSLIAHRIERRWRIA